MFEVRILRIDRRRAVGHSGSSAQRRADGAVGVPGTQEIQPDESAMV